ncbi:hypothetical protein BC830DRAFT_913594 [Chytriomyces sp. MP71]|nr:hypothetical protein BC830DRAFT_913594 [Chytriomyces sp. MP71]
MDLANLGSVSSNGVVSHLPETSLEPLNLHTLSISIPSNSIHIATVSTAERDAWIYALKAMRSSSQAVTATPSNPPRYTSETDETLQIQLQQSQERIAQLEAKLAARNDTGTDAGGSCASATSSDIVALIDAKMAEIMEAIWAAHSTSSRTAETVHATVLTREESDTDVEARLSTIGDVEVAIQDLTESMEMRTSRIGKMVHELLPVKDDVKRIVAAIEGQQGAGLVGVPDPNGVNLLKRVIEDQKSISNDVGTLLSIAAESSLAQRVAWDELSREAKERHNALKQTFLGMSAEPGLRKCIEDLLQDDFVRSKFTETIRSIFLDLKCSLSDRSPEGSDSNGGGSATMDEILHEKLDNVGKSIYLERINL